MKKTVICIVGTRPEVIKMAPVIRALREVPGLAVSVMNSGQHRELLLPLVDWFELRVDSDLRVMTENQTLAQLTGQLITSLERQLQATRTDLVLAQGDTTTVMCAGLAAFYLGIPFGHVEAGLRTYDMRNPFPEEFNRVTVGKLAQLHFAPTRKACDNLRGEHVDESRIHLTGNTVIDALNFTTGKLTRTCGRDFRHDILLTAHRRENFGAPLEGICGAIIDLCEEFPDLRVLYPVHPNPNVRSVAERMLSNHPRIELAAPLDYPDLVAAMRQAKIILTDSGGIQEEAPALAKPVLVLRKVTERPEAIELGVARLVGPIRSAIVAETRNLLRNPLEYKKMARGGSPYGDGAAALRIRDVVCKSLGVAGESVMAPSDNI